MSAPKKPDYPALRKRIERMHTGGKGDIEALLALHDRAVWLEGQRSASQPIPLNALLSPAESGKGFRGTDFKKGRDK